MQLGVGSWREGRRQGWPCQREPDPGCLEYKELDADLIVDEPTALDILTSSDRLCAHRWLCDFGDPRSRERKAVVPPS